ncbi:DUF4173 domain-containing protein [Ruminococcus sp.]|uniref:DUF4153 domain-containing protein n=1 Tax=Ruminococcus sp. TaxID=41978 RepID=UPI0025D93D53|nr:DUF4173 domain-containing protein [Ruminococcus sp.]MBQ8966417.1 DUF4173 domain-containing protein [Ruminococcus sp.]
MNENNNLYSGQPMTQQNGQPCYNNYHPYPAQYQAVPKREPIEFTSAEKKLSYAALILGFLFVQFVFWNVKGYFTTAVFILIFSVIGIYLHKKEYKFSTSNKIWSAILYIFSTTFSITDNSFIKNLDMIFLIIGEAYLIYSVTTKRPMFGQFSVFEIAKSTLADPLSHFDKEFLAANSQIKMSRTGKYFKTIIGGLIVAVPLTVIVGALLVSADPGVERMITTIIDAINIPNLFTFIEKIFVSIPVAAYIFGQIYSHTNPDKIKALNEEDCSTSIRKLRMIQNAAIYSAITPICVLYVMFFISQANYFLSAFMGSLPENYGYADYARRGFFELFAIELINAGVIFVMNFFSKKTGEEKPLALKLYSIVIAVFTLLITATAISKMVLYIRNFGLTQLRVYTTWFMVLTAFAFIFIIIRQFRHSFPFLRAAAVTFTIFFAVLCFSRPDALIARYNMENCTDSMTFNDIREMTLLSSDAAAIVLEPEYAFTVDRMYENARYYEYKNFDSGRAYLENITNHHINHDPYYQYNFSSFMLKQVMKE